MTKLWKFPAMLGSAEDWPVGSPEWAERISSILQSGTESISRSTAHLVGKRVKAIFKADPKPWEVWPPKRPFGTPDDYCRAVTGHTWIALIEIVNEFRDRGLPDDPEWSAFTKEVMQAELARAQVKHRGPGRPSKNHAQGMISQLLRLRSLRRLRPRQPWTSSIVEAGQLELEHA
jgi:hypothetical protein